MKNKYVIRISAFFLAFVICISILTFDFKKAQATGATLAFLGGAITASEAIETVVGLICITFGAYEISANWEKLKEGVSTEYDFIMTELADWCVESGTNINDFCTQVCQNLSYSMSGSLALGREGIASIQTFYDWLCNKYNTSTSTETVTLINNYPVRRFSLGETVSIDNEGSWFKLLYPTYAFRQGDTVYFINIDLQYHDSIAQCWSKWGWYVDYFLQNQNGFDSFGTHAQYCMKNYWEVGGQTGVVYPTIPDSVPITDVLISILGGIIGEYDILIDGVDVITPDVVLPLPDVGFLDPDVLPNVPDGTITYNDFWRIINSYYQNQYTTITENGDSITIVNPLNPTVPDTDEAEKEQYLPSIIDLPSYNPLPSDTPADSKILFGIEKYFPFCIPFDLVNFIKKLYARPITPEFDYHIYLDGVIDKIIHISFAEYDSLFEKLRYAEVAIFLIGLMFLTPKLINPEEV